MTPAAFLRALWGDRPPGYIQLWQLAAKRSTFLHAPAAADAFQGMPDVYTRVTLTADNLGARARGTTAQSCALAGLWADIDVDGGPEHKHGAAPDLAAALELAAAVAQPTLLIHSGYGLHAWWLLDRPWQLHSDHDREAAATMAAQWIELHQRAARGRGFHIDSTQDLARLLRIPGSVNAKAGRRADVYVLGVNQRRRYPRPALADLCAACGPIHTAAPTIIPAVEPGEGAGMEAKLSALLDNDEVFAQTWRHQRNTGWSASEFDMSITAQAVAAGFTDPEIAWLIGQHRSDSKARRTDYLTRTICKARSHHAMISRLGELAGRG